MRAACAALLALAVGGLWAGGARADVYLVQQGADTSAYAFVPETPRGDRPTAYAYTNFLAGQDHSFEYYIRMDIPPDLVPPEAEVTDAFLWFYYGYDYTIFADTSAELGEIRCHEVLSPWNPDTLTWNNSPAIGPEFDGWDGITQFGTYWCDVTELVRGWLADPSTNDGVAITSGAPRVMGYYTFERSDVGTNFKPSLVIETQPLPEPGALPGLCAGIGGLGLLSRRGARRRAAWRTSARV